MSEEKRVANGFRIKWADIEIEYYGDSVPEMFRIVFEHVKNVPISSAQPVQPQGQKTIVPATTSPPAETVSTVGESDAYKRVADDAQVTEEQVLSVIKFEKRPNFPQLVPCLPAHPVTRDAVMLVSYALQLGLQKTQIELPDVKKLLREIGYPLPGNELGLILADFRATDVTIASQTKGRNKPFSLSTKGLEKARNLVKTSVR